MITKNFLTRMPAKMCHVPLMSHKPFVALNTSRMKIRIIFSHANTQYTELLAWLIIM